MNTRQGRWIPGMDHYSDQTSTEFHEVEAKLAVWARRQPVPPRLADRVFDASVGLLPARTVRRARLLQLPPPASLRTRISAWGSRLALAASIALALFIGNRVLPPPGFSALLTPDVEMVLLESAGGPSRLLDPRFAEVQDILLTRDMTFGDLTGDLARIAHDLEM